MSKTNEENILSLIPQRPPFVMIDKLVNSDDTGSSSTFLVKEDNLLLSDGKFSEAGLVENIAQTAAARAGYAVARQNEQVKIGYIGAVKNLEIFALPEVNDLLETEIKIENQIFDVTVISGKVLCKGRLLAQCEMKIFTSPT